MSDTVKLIIEIPESDYKAICANKEDAIIAHDTCRRIANNGIPLDENKGEWIPVSEKLPEKNIECLVAVGKFNLTQIAMYSDLMGTISHRIFYQGDVGYDSFVDITEYVNAWQPLPEPYKAESEEV